MGTLKRQRIHTFSLASCFIPSKRNAQHSYCGSATPYNHLNTIRNLPHLINALLNSKIFTHQEEDATVFVQFISPKRMYVWWAHKCQVFRSRVSVLPRWPRGPRGKTEVVLTPLSSHHSCYEFQTGSRYYVVCNWWFSQYINPSASYRQHFFFGEWTLKSLKYKLGSMATKMGPVACVHDKWGTCNLTAVFIRETTSLPHMRLNCLDRIFVSSFCRFSVYKKTGMLWCFCYYSCKLCKHFSFSTKKVHFWFNVPKK